MGWLFFAVFALAALLATWRMKLPGGGLTMVAAAIALAGAGYAAQGRPGLEAAPGPASDSDIGELADRLFAIRAEMDRNFGPHVAPLALADSALRHGNSDLALAAIEGGLANAPDNPELLSARALALYIATRGDLTPAVELAFEQARAGGEHPGSDYFEGLANLFDSRIDRTEALWTRALKRKWPPGEWHANVAAQLAALQRLEAEAQRMETEGADAPRAVAASPAMDE